MNYDAVEEVTQIPHVTVAREICSILESNFDSSQLISILTVLLFIYFPDSVVFYLKLIDFI